MYFFAWNNMKWQKVEANIKNERINHWIDRHVFCNHISFTMSGKSERQGRVKRIAMRTRSNMKLKNLKDTHGDDKNANITQLSDEKSHGQILQPQENGYLTVQPQEKGCPILQVSVADYIGKCPHCLQETNKRDTYYKVNPTTDKDYLTYTLNSKKQFGDYSLPLCYRCWRTNCEKCQGCWLPMGDIAFSGAFGRILLAKTTVAPGNCNDHVCDSCVTLP